MRPLISITILDGVISMMRLLTILTCLFILSPNVVFGGAVTSNDFIERNSLLCKKFAGVPLIGKEETYYANGQLLSKGVFKNSFMDGPWIFFKNGTVDMKKTGIYRKNKKIRN